jgi:hypothetical protein
MMTPLQSRGLLKIGDLLCPGDGQHYPRFKDAHALQIAPILLQEMNPKDRTDFLMLLAVFGLLPSLLIRPLYFSIERFAASFGIFRLLSLGIRGFVFAIYYSEESGVLTQLPYQVQVHID